MITSAPASPPSAQAASSVSHATATALAALPLHDDRAQLAATPNHLHLVMGDGDARVVLTVAVRGADINVSMRTSDDSTAASFARNAGSLDDAMRGRGLHLNEFSAERDAADQRPRRDRPEPAPDATTPDSEPFVLEETP